MRRFTKLLSAAVLCMTSLGACKGDDADGGAGMSGAECLAPLDLDCDEAYSPTFDTIYDRRLHDTCATGGANCHGSSGNQGGLSMADADSAYQALVGGNGGRARVIPGDPECSLLIRRLESTDPNFLMPRGGRLAPGERCTIRKWVANGAERR